MARNRQEQPPRATREIAVLDDERLARTRTVDGVLRLYADLPQDEITEQHEGYHDRLKGILWGAINEYGSSMEELHSRPVVSRFHVDQVTQDLHRAIDSARRINLDPSVVAPISFEFLDQSLRPDKQMPGYVREAIAEMGMAIGDDAILREKVEHVVGRHKQTLQEGVRQGQFDARQVDTLNYAEALLGANNIEVEVSETPSAKQNLAHFAEQHRKKIITAGAATLVAATLIPASPAAAEEKAPTAANETVSNETPKNKDENKEAAQEKKGVQASVAVPTAEATPTEETKTDNSKKETEVTEPEVVTEDQSTQPEATTPPTSEPTPSETPQNEAAQPETEKNKNDRAKDKANTEETTPEAGQAETGTEVVAPEAEAIGVQANGNQGRGHGASVGMPSREAETNNEATPNANANEQAEAVAPQSEFIGAAEAAAPAVETREANVGMHDTDEAQADSAPYAISGAPAAAPQVSNEVTVAVNPNIEVEAEDPFFVTPSAAVIAPHTIDPANIDASRRSVDAEGNPLNAEAFAVGPEVSSTGPRLDPETATPEQLAMQTIRDAIINEGDVETAVTLLNASFHDKNQPATSFKNGKPIYNVTNTEMVKNAIGHEITFSELIANKGHSNAPYVNNALSAIAVLTAAANDQSILNSAEVQQLVGGVVRPSEPYQGKLFDQTYLPKAKEALAANNGALMAGFSESYRPQIETLYAYILMANVSEQQQGAEIQAIKDAEARSAAGLTDIEAAAADPNKMLMLGIERAAQANGWSQSKLVFHRTLASMGVPLAPLAGLSGNIDIESAGFNPAILERGWEDDPNRGLGLVQYTNYMGDGVELDGNGQAIGGRRTVYEQAARAAGFDPRSDTSDAFIQWQIQYIVQESQSRPQRDSNGNEWAGMMSQQSPTEAAYYWQRNFERAGIPHNEAREASAQRTFDQINSQFAGIQQDAAEAKAAREAAEAERRKMNGMNMEQANAFMHDLQNNPDSLNYLGGAGQDCAGGPMSNCVSTSTVFINKFTTAGGFMNQNPGDGWAVAGRVAERNPGVALDSTPRPGAIWSYSSGEFGHTGIVLGVWPEQDLIITGEAFCSGGTERDGAIAHSLSEWSDGSVRYAHPDLKGPLW